MLVKHIMIPRSQLTEVALQDTVGDTIALIDSHNLLSLPVVDGDDFVGIISKKYIFEQYFNENGDKEAFLSRPIADFMKTKIKHVEEGDLVEVPANVLLQENLQFIPVVGEKGKFSGIVTHKTIFKTFTKILGFGHTRIAVTTHDTKGKLAKLADIITKQGGNIISIAEIDVEVMNLREIILRVDIEDPKKLISTLGTHGFAVRHVHEA
ncbi:MAG: CBS domain-containing protein [Cellulosilyticaceae bacterium]